ncbi:MAG: hypothetical protein AB7I08_07440 [Thermoleophilia bacterium]
MPSGSDGRGRLGRQRGSSLITTIALTGILALLVLASLSFARSSTHQTARQARADIAIQVADAGVNQYVSRLVEDPRYYEHYVDPAEDPRIDPTGRVFPPGSDWTPGVTWTYAGPPQTWRPLQEGRFGNAAYSLRVTPPPPGSDIVTVLSTAQSDRASSAPVTRTIQSQVRPSSLADFQMISNATIRYGSAATTTGKLYSAVDINHQGVARAPAYAAHFTCSHGNSSAACTSNSVPSSVYQEGAYTSATVPSFSDQFPTPIDFGQFTKTRLDIRDAARAQNLEFNDPSADAWMIQFLADGRVRVWMIDNTTNPGASIGSNGYICRPTVTLPSGTALAYMYFEQSVIVSDGSTRRDNCGATNGPRPSVVNGFVSVATKGNVYIGGNIAYASPGNDILGLIAAGEVIITEYTPSVLTWRAATLAQSGQWRTNRSSQTGNHDSMLYIGSQTTFGGGYASMFENREYQWDETLARLRPPLYPVLEGSWETFYWREVRPPV